MYGHVSYYLSRPLGVCVKKIFFDSRGFIIYQFVKLGWKMIKTKNVGVHLRHISKWVKEISFEILFGDFWHCWVSLSRLFITTTEQQTLKKVLLSMFVVIQKSILIYLPNLSISHEFFASSVCRLSFLSTWSKNLLFRILFQPQYSPLLKYLDFKRKKIKIKNQNDRLFEAIQISICNSNSLFIVDDA